MTEPATPATKERGPGRPKKGDRREDQPTRLLLTLDLGMAEEIDRHRKEVERTSDYEPSRQAVLERALAEYLCKGEGR